jgi:DNA-binding response OmpR family regulator
MEQQNTERDHILIVTEDPTTSESLVSTLETAGGYRVSMASNFREALDQMLAHKYALALVDVKLPDLSGIDLLTAAGVMRSDIPVILIDDALSAKSAVAAFRMGAIDYLSKPINLEFVLMRIDRELKLIRKRLPEKPPRTAPERPPEDRPAVRAASMALKVSQDQFRDIDRELNALYTGISAQFIGLVDGDHNLVGTAGKLDNCDLLLLTKALGSDKESSQPLLDILGESSFYSTYFEGSSNGVYIIDFGHPQAVSLVVICSVKAKRGMVWLYSKRTAIAIDRILKQLHSPEAPQTISG